jgi:hypothetical protein
MRLITAYYVYMDVWRSGDITPSFLTLALDVGNWSTWRHGRFTLGERPLDKRLDGPQSRSGRNGRGKILALPEKVFIIIFNKGKYLDST